MSMKRWCCTAAIICIATTAAARKQVVVNGSFEVVNPDNPILPASWALFNPNAFRDNAQSLDGDWSVSASLDDASFIGGFQNTVSVTEGVRVYMQAYARTSAPLTGGAVAGIKLEFFPPEGIVIPPPVENLEFRVDPNDPNAYPDDVWVEVTITETVPADMNIVRAVVLSFDNSTTNGPVYVDSAHMEYASNPGVNVLLNPSFELGSSGPNGLTNWNEFAGAGSGARRNVFEVPADDGTAVCKITGITAGLTQNVAGTPGDVVTLRAKFRSSSALSYADLEARAGVKLEWSPGTMPPQVDIAPNANPVSATTNIIKAGDPVGVWLPVIIDYTIPPANAAGLRATVISGFGPAAGVDVWFDSFEMVLTNVFDGSDADGDNDSDMLDIAQLQNVFTGSGGGMVFGGIVFDHDEDDDVDNFDADYTIDRMTGPGAP